MRKRGIILVALLAPLGSIAIHVITGLMGRSPMLLDDSWVAVVFGVYAHAQQEKALQRTAVAFLAHLLVLSSILAIWAPMRQVIPLVALVTGVGAFIGFLAGRTVRRLVGSHAA